MTSDEFLKKLAHGDGRIVSTGDLLNLQIAEARANSTMHVLEGGLGFVILPWNLSTPKDRERETDFFASVRTKTKTPPVQSWRQVRVDLETKGEALIRKAMQHVEDLGSDPRLTDAVLSLTDALAYLGSYQDDQLRDMLAKSEQ